MWRLISAGTDFVAAGFLFLSMNWITTETANIFDKSGRAWAWTRRAIYAVVCFALFWGAVYRIEYRSSGDMSAQEALSHMIVTFGIVFFPLMRVLGVITQDRILRPPDRIDAALKSLFNGESSRNGVNQ